MFKPLLFCLAILAWSFGEDLGSGMSSTTTLPVAPNCNSPILLQRNPACAFGATKYLVVWSDGRQQPIANGADIYCARVEATTGSVLDPSGILVCHANGVQGFPSVAFDGANFLVVWEDMRSRNDYDIYGARVSEAGQVLDVNAFAISANAGINEARPCVAFANGNYMVVWNDARRYPVYGIYGSRVTPAGLVLDPGGIAIDVEDSAKLASKVPANGRFMGNGGYSNPTWWGTLLSRDIPALAGNGKSCFLVYRSEEIGLKWGLIDPATGAYTAADQSKIPYMGDWFTHGDGAIKNLAATPMANNGWAINANIVATGWGLSSCYMGIRVDSTMNTTDTGSPKKGDYTNCSVNAGNLGAGESGRGGVYTHKTSCGLLGGNLLLAMDYAWRVSEVYHSAILINRMAPASQSYLEAQAGLLLEDNGGNIVVKYPAICSGPNNECLLVFQKDAGANNCVVVSKVIRGK